MAESEEIQGSAVHRTMGELVRFGIVGVAHNLLGYLVYLLITWLGTDPKVAVAILYPIGTAVSFFANRQWTFEDKGHVGQSMTRYISMHAFGYVLNIFIIYLGVDVLAFPHQLVQLFAMGFLAMLFFLISKLLIFNER
jgi:putative flippase GtrA